MTTIRSTSRVRVSDDLVVTVPATPLRPRDAFGLAMELLQKGSRRIVIDESSHARRPTPRAKR